MKKIVIIGILIAAILGGAYAYYMFNKKVESISNKKADFTISANELFDAFDGDEEAANAKYIGKIIEITGAVESVESNDTSANVVLIADNALIGGINCQMEKGVSLEGISEGSQTKLKCECQGFLMNVVLNNCVKVNE